MASGGLQGYMTGRSLSGSTGTPGTPGRPSTIDLGGGKVSRYMPGTDQYSI